MNKVSPEELQLLSSLQDRQILLGEKYSKTLQWLFFICFLLILLSFGIVTSGKTLHIQYFDFTFKTPHLIVLLSIIMSIMHQKSISFHGLLYEIDDRIFTIYKAFELDNKIYTDECFDSLNYPHLLKTMVHFKSYKGFRLGEILNSLLKFIVLVLAWFLPVVTLLIVMFNLIKIVECWKVLVIYIPLIIIEIIVLITSMKQDVKIAEKIKNIFD